MSTSHGLAGHDIHGLLVLVPEPKSCGRARDPCCIKRNGCQSGGQTSGVLHVDGKIHCLALKTFSSRGTAERASRTRSRLKRTLSADELLQKESWLERYSGLKRKRRSLRRVDVATGVALTGELIGTG